MGAIQTRHHLLRWGKGADKETTCLFAEWWVLSEYNSFDHFPKRIRLGELVVSMETKVLCQWGSGALSLEGVHGIRP